MASSARIIKQRTGNRKPSCILGKYGAMCLRGWEEKREESSQTSANIDTFIRRICIM